MDSVAGGAPGSSGGAGSDCEGEDQEDSSSSHSVSRETVTALTNLTVNDQAHIVGEDQDALSAFRQEWQRELKSTPSPQHQPSMVTSKVESEPENDDEKAKRLFLRGVELERSGKLYEAVQHYKRAVQLQPDVERRLYEAMDTRADTPEVSTEVEPELRETSPNASDEDEDDDGDLMARFQRSLAKKGQFCEMEHPQKGAHLSWLPWELVLSLLRWTVGADLDAAALARAGAVSRGFYLASRDTDIWRDICLRTWGIECGSPKTLGYGAWRDMYIERPRLRLDGCYISKTTYLRPGENSFQDQFYRPWHLIDYYRYLRFFPEGLVLMRTTAEEPQACVGALKTRRAAAPGLLAGHYRLIGDKVIIVLKKQANEKKATLTSNTRFRARRKESVHETQEQIFHLELQLRSIRGRRNWQLVWRGYSVSARRDLTSFELAPGRYPPFAFSPVRGYTTHSEAPLA